MNKSVFSGAACAIITPFDENLKVDCKALKKLIDFQIDNGTDAIVVCGTTGESAVLDAREHRQVIKATVKHVGGRVPVIAGTGSNSTATAIKRSITAEECGADALLIVTPYYNKCSQSGLYEHYKAISDKVNLPIIVYNVPSRTGLDIKPETYKKLSQIDNVVATKEANGNLSALMETISLCANRLDIYSGNDDQTAAFIAMGAKGVISVMSNILPKATGEIAHCALNGRNTAAVRLQTKYLELSNSLFSDVNPIPVKYAMKKMGLDRGFYRLPLNEPSDEVKRNIDLILIKYGLLK